MDVFETKNLTIKRVTKGKLPSLPFVRIKNEILGKEYDLSIIFIKKTDIEKLSNKWKGSKEHKNILSFPISKKSGEIILNLETIRIEAKDYNKKYIQYLGFLVIHGMLHLKGMTHSSKMEREENRLMKLFHL